VRPPGGCRGALPPDANFLRFSRSRRRGYNGVTAGVSRRSGQPDSSVAARDDDIDNNNDNNNGFRVVCAASTFFRVPSLAGGAIFKSHDTRLQQCASTVTRCSHRSTVCAPRRGEKHGAGWSGLHAARAVRGRRPRQAYTKAGASGAPASRPSPETEFLKETRFLIAVSDCQPRVARIHPPSILPSSVTIALTWAYWPPVSQPHSCARRR